FSRMTCNDAQTFLSAYFDRELDVTKSLEMEEHLRQCHRCTALLRQHQTLHSSLHSASLRFAPPPDLERHIRKAVRRDAGPASGSVRPRWRWLAMPMAATLVGLFAWSITNGRSGPSRDDLLSAELVSGHIRSLMADHLVDVAASDQHTVKPWFNGKVDFAPPVTDFTASGFPLVGGRVDYITGRPAAVLVYPRRQHLVNAFIWPSAQPEAEALRNLTFDTYHLVRWSASGLTFWAVSDVSDADLESLAHLFQNPT